ncbi:hypothetical protein IE81DRAFT_327122 [Ceraceosorus guamensis]|uniref:Cation-transporting ATPase n=1 Tax=Ceraceosorus guamensis TaxID=1522189 RepID=A0A316VNB6_9BASI|nr:hypothetical protein IE81DRAFT_327122 [Ceraceosorus guamensis]PWN38810.1 hypothetical protein IE81DRAFT_327122 [Ceraceosorus guamensis]
MTSKKVNGKGNGNVNVNGKQPFDVAADEYQSPFSLPPRPPTEPSTQPSSPFFDDAERAEALAWAREHDGDAETNGTGTAAEMGISIGGRRRRDSQVGSYADDGGLSSSIFDGPTAGAVPSSVSSMHHHLSRPELSRRASNRSRQRISREYSNSPTRSRKISTSSIRSSGDLDDAEADDTRSAAESVRSIAARSSFGRKRRVASRREAEEVDASEERPRGVLGSFMASLRGGQQASSEEQDASGSQRPLMSRRRSSSSVVSRSSRPSSDRGGGGGWSEEEYGTDDNEDEDDQDGDYISDADSLHSSTSDEDGDRGRGGLLPSAFGMVGGQVDPVFGDNRVTLDHEPRDELDEELGASATNEAGAGDSSGFARGRSGFLPDIEAAAAAPTAAAQEAARVKEEMSYLDKDSRSKQQIYLAEDDALIRFTGYRSVPTKQLTYTLACILTLGIVYLLGRWLPRWRLRWVCTLADFDSADFIIVENQWGDMVKVKPDTVPFARPLATVFPVSSREPPSTPAEHQSAPPVALPPGLVLNGKSASARSSIAEASKIAPAQTRTPASSLPMLAGVQTEQLMELTFLDYRYTRFALHPPSGRWRMIKDWRDPTWTSTASAAKGISWDAEKDRTTLFGENVIDIAGKTTWQLLVDEVLHPFYMFQIVSIVLWSIDDYYYYAACIALISAASIITTLLETKRTIARMRAMSRFTCPVRVLREGSWADRDSSELVPGDVYDVAESSLLLFPADSVLLSGDAIVNESMLTGESVPVSKVPLADSGMLGLHSPSGEISPDLARHFLFAGTRIIRIRPTTGGGDDAGAKAMVVRTGFDTTKGALVRSMLFPKPMGFKFYRDSFRFIGFLAGIAGVGFLASSINFIKLGIGIHTIILRALDLITVVVPPALPATMSIGTTFAIARLRKGGIFCISPNRVNIGGKINVVCFDKTGTLTADGLDVLGTRTIDLRAKRFSELHETVEEMPVNGSNTPSDVEARKMPLLYALATCHSLKVVDGEVIGDPLDVKMFEYTGWTLDEGKDAAQATTKSGTAKDGKSRLTDRAPALVQTVVRPPGGQHFEVEDAVKPGKHAHFLELGVLRTFEFVSQLRRMSVIVKRLKSPSMEVYVKGAPEVMTEICERDSFPADYDDLLAYYTKHGYRVIACAGKTMPNMSWIKAQRMKREQAESKLRFLGLIIFENKIKEGTAPAIQELMNANIVCKMATGDNPRTAISVARECGMVDQSAHVFLPTFVHGDQKSPDAVIDWSSVDDERVKLDAFRLKPLRDDPHLDELDFQDYQLAVTGDIFRWMIDYAPIETLRRMLIKGTIFARMSPDEKHELIERLQALGYTTGMCGDGANDCGALKAADVGISLSEAEASVAAPFTSSSPDISCVIDVIKEGRAAITCSFGCFSFMALYSLIQFTTITLLYGFASSLGDFQFLYIDLGLIIPLAVAMARGLPFDTIHPKRPTANLVSKKVLISMLGQVVICAAAQFFTFFYTRAQPWYTPPIVNPDKLDVVNPENSALFLVSSFQYIIVCAIFSVGPPYRKPLYTNPMLVAALVILSFCSLYFLFVPSGFIFELLGLVEFPRSFHFALLAVVLVNTAACFAFDAYGKQPLTSAIKAMQRYWRRRNRRDERVTKSGKVYKQVAAGMIEEA